MVECSDLFLYSTGSFCQTYNVLSEVTKGLSQINNHFKNCPQRGVFLLWLKGN